MKDNSRLVAISSSHLISEALAEAIIQGYGQTLQRE